MAAETDRTLTFQMDDKKFYFFTVNLHNHDQENLLALVRVTKDFYITNLLAWAYAYRWYLAIGLLAGMVVG